jgi:hypothetical protein
MAVPDVGGGQKDFSSTLLREKSEKLNCVKISKSFNFPLIIKFDAIWHQKIIKTLLFLEIPRELRR